MEHGLSDDPALGLTVCSDRETLMSSEYCTMQSMERIIRAGDRFDALWRLVGLDLHGYALKNPTRARRIGIWLIAIGETIGYAGLYYIFAALLFFWDQSLSWSKEALTAAFTCSILTGAAVSPIAGRAIDRGRGRWLLGGGLLLGGMALVLLSTAETYSVFFLSWLLLGLAQGASLYEPTFAFVTRTTGAEAARNITKITLVAGFASTIAFPAATLLAGALGWQGAVLVFAGIVGGVGAIALFAGATLIECCPETGNSAQAIARDRQAFHAAVRRPEFWLILIAFALSGMAAWMVITHIIPILTSQGLSLAQAVAVSALVGPMQVVGRLALLAFGTRVSPLTTTAWTFLGLIAAFVLLANMDVLAVLAYPYAILFGASFGLMSLLKPIVSAEVLGRTGFGVIAGWIALPTLVVTAFAPPLGALLERLGGYSLALTVAAGATVAALLALIVLILLARHA